MRARYPRRVSQVRDVYEQFRVLIHEVAKFGVVGAFNAVLDIALFNWLHFGQGVGPLTSKAISVTVAATSSYFMNRHWTWRHRARRGVMREYGTFIGLSAIALAITIGCLAFGEYVLHQDSLLARNIWGNVVGVGAAMVWRFWSYKRWVFLPEEVVTTGETVDSVLL
jgi:putative flippase GtrA